jgi:ABC-type transport system substrate-binding protein
LPADAQVQRVIFASAGFDETNRFWVISRPNQLQNDPYLETLLDLDPKTGAFIPRLAEKWEGSPDMKEWTLFLRKGVPFHFGYGEFTARDVVHSHALMLREEAVATFVGMWRNVEEVKVINENQVVFRMKGPATTLPYALSRRGDLRMVSKAQWDKEGLEGFEKRPAGTGSYQYVSRQLGQSIVFERVENHWRGIRPAFKELEMRIAPEESTRLAILLNGEAHIVDLARELQVCDVQDREALRALFAVSAPFDILVNAATGGPRAMGPFLQMDLDGYRGSFAKLWGYTNSVCLAAKHMAASTSCPLGLSILLCLVMIWIDVSSCCPGPRPTI